MKKLILAMVVITMALLVSISNEQNTIIVYSSMEQFRGEELQQQLNEKFPDLHVMVMYVSTAKAAAKISVEQEQSDADIVVGLETSYMEKIKDQLADIKGKSRLQYLDGLAPKDHGNAYVTWERQAGAFIINTDVLKKHKLCFCQYKSKKNLLLIRKKHHCFHPVMLLRTILFRLCFFFFVENVIHLPAYLHTTWFINKDFLNNL